jgi:hypothetical protein
MNIDNAKLLDQLLKAEAETDVEAILQRAGYLTDDDSIWKPFGGNEMNFSQINNQQADPTPALVEKLINSIDAVLMAESYKSGIDPKGNAAPNSMSEAVEKFFKVKDGRLENLTASARTKLADNIHFIATGSKDAPCYLVVDKGEGQTPASFEKTFLSLNRRNKNDIPFVQGRFNCGGTGVLPFCGKNNYQLILSRRNPTCPVDAGDSTKDLWGFTIVRKLRPANGRGFSMYVYLAPQGKILTFAAPDGVAVLAGQSSKNRPASAYSVKLPYGSCIKLYNYRWKKKAIVTTDGRYELERFLHSVCLPFRLSESRDYKANYYSTTLSGIMATTNDEGNEEGDPNSKFEKDFRPAYGELNLPNIGRLPCRVFLLKEEYRSRNFPHGVYFTLNGQVHGELPANFVTSVLKFDCLSGYLMVSIDCTDMNQAVREEFMMASRDRVRRNEVYDEIYRTVRDELKEHPGLRQHNALRKKKRLEETLANEDKAVDYFQEILKSDPTLSSVLATGGNVISTTGPTNDPEPFNGKKFPTYFRIIKEPKGGLVKSCPLNRNIRVEFETDADNDYFERADCPGSISFDPPNLCVTSHLWNGKFSTKFQMPYNAKVGDVLNLNIAVTDIERDTKDQPFVCNFTMKGVPETDDPQPGQPGASRSDRKPQTNGKQTAPSLAMPRILEVRRDKWEDPFYDFNEFSAVKISDSNESNGYDFFVNVDNQYLINELHRAKEEDKALIKHWFVYGVVLAGIGVLGELQRLQAEGRPEPDDEENGKELNDLNLVGRFCAGVARVIVPIIRSVHNVPAAVETAASPVS